MDEKDRDVSRRIECISERADQGLPTCAELELMEIQLIDPEGNTAPEEMKSRVESALLSMEALRLVAERKLGELNAMTEADLKAADLVALQRDLGKALTLALVEEGKVTDALRSQYGGDGIDFDAARAAVRRRLDRIRANLDPGSVSDGAVGE